MGTGYIIKLLGFALLTIASLSSCSLDQRSIAGGMARIQLNTRSQTGGPARLATVSGVSLPTASSYYVVDVEGEGIPRQVIEPTRCVKASPLSSAMVPALVQAGETQRTEIELLVPVGANRKIRIIRVDLNIPAGSSMPMWAENPFGYKSRNPAYAVSGEMYVLAEADIPFLSGDQSVTLVEKATALPIQNQCNLGTMQPFIGNNDVELMNYEPWEGVNASGQPRPYVMWKDPTVPHHLVFRGEFKNKSNVSINPPGFAPAATPFTNLSAPHFYPNIAGGPLPGSSLPPQAMQFYQWVIPVDSPSPSPEPYSANISFPYQVGATSSSITHSFPLRVLSASPPIANPSATPVSGYGNLFRAPIVFTRAGALSPVRRWGGLVSMAPSQVDLDPFSTRGLLQQFPTSTVIPSVSAIALDPPGTNIFVATGPNINRYTKNGTALPAVTASEDPLALLVAGNYLVYVDFTQYVRFYNFTLTSPTPQNLYDGGATAKYAGLTLDNLGNLVLADPGQHAITRLSAAQFQGALAGGPTPAPGSVPAYSGVFGTSGATDGSLIAARYSGPSSIASDPSGNLYVADVSNNKIRRISSAGTVSTLADPSGGYPNLEKVAWGGDGLYVSDSGLNKIFRIPSSGTPEVYAGGGSQTDGLAEDIVFGGPVGLAFDSQGVLYVGDSSKLMRMIPACRVSENGMEIPRAFATDQSCDFFFRVFSGGGALATASSAPILKTKLSDASGLEGYHTQNLAGSGYPATDLSGSALGLVYNSTLTSALTITKSQVMGAGGTWKLPDDSTIHSNPVIERVRLKSDAGETVSTAGITLSLSQITIPRLVNGAPVREFEVVYQARRISPQSIEFLKQSFRFNPVNPANISVRLFVGSTPVENAFQACLTTSTWTVKAFAASNELPAGSTAAQAKFNGTSGTGAGSLVAFTPVSGPLSISNVIGYFKSLDGDLATPPGAWSGTVSSSGACVFLNSVAPGAI